MNDKTQLLKTIRERFKSGASASDVLRYLAIDCSIEDQVELMILISDALEVGLGTVTSIGGWWHEGTKELNDEDINAYLTPVVEEWLEG